MTETVGEMADDWDEVLEQSGENQYLLRLYVSGMTLRCIDAITQIKEICETYLENRYRLEVIDIYQQPILARNDQIIATPTLLRVLPLPLRRLVGDLSNTRRVLGALDIQVPRKESS
ncbi:MAG: circadian clock KaiB family protein [Gemmataceae bacterium]